MGSRALLCTLGRRSEDTGSYPKDGVCDFLFYDSYYTRRADTFMDDSSGRTQHFLASAKDSFSTQYGIAVAHGKFTPDGLVARTHIIERDSRANATLTGPSVYRKPPSNDQPGIAETLHYILQHEGLLRQTTIMTSFSMSVRWYHSVNNLFDAGAPSTNTNVTSANELCKLADDYSAYKTVETQHFTQAYSDKNGYTATFDDTLTILWKLCSAFVEFRNATFGTAFFDVDYEDWQELCPQDEWKGYARLTAARDYFQHLKEPDSKSLNCSELVDAE
ncbi:hypothetical protein ISCGN_014137 [Ixodes scapularis]